MHDSEGSFSATSLDFCRELCAAHEVELEVVRLQAKPLMEVSDLSWEAAARSLRYQEVQGRGGVFMTAHTADDQAETLVMRLLDGSALAGLAGIRESRPPVLRPLLPFRRSELRAFLAEKKQTWVDDPSNLGGNDRAELRCQLMPLVERLEPAFVKKASRTAKRLARDEEALSGFARDWLESSTHQGDWWFLHELRELSPAVRYRVIREIWRRTAEPFERPLGSLFEEAERLIQQGADNRYVACSRGRLRRLGQRLWYEPQLEPARWELELGDLCHREGRYWAIHSSPLPSPGRLEVNIAPPPEGSQLLLRSRRPGDRIEGKDLIKTLARSGHPPWVRDRWPLLVLNDQIVALPGKPKGEPTKAGSWTLSFWPGRLRASVTELKKDELFEAAEKDY